MANETMEIGSTPPEESCAQTGITGNCAVLERLECRAFIVALRRKHGEPPEGAEFFIKSNPHDFGTYRQVAVRFDPAVKEAVEYAFKCEGDSPATWAEVGMRAPVTYDEHSQAIHVIEEPEQWILVETDPLVLAARQARDALHALASHPAFAGADAPEFNAGGIGFEAADALDKALAAAVTRNPVSA